VVQNTGIIGPIGRNTGISHDDYAYQLGYLFTMLLFDFIMLLLASRLAFARNVRDYFKGI